ncbi:MAG: cache domain-containing protein, partial [Lacunisphaera sp.]|nr:cache domain-containing protein [Lacunisphaera sp.]
MNWNLRNRILVPTAALLILVIIAISAVSFWMGRSSMEVALDQQLDQIGSSGIRQVDSWIDGQRQNVAHWAAQPHVLTALGQTPESGAARSVLNGELAHALQTYGFFANLQLVDLNGDTLSSSNPESVGKLNVADRQYFKEAAAGKPAVSEVLKSKTTGSPIVVIASPVKEGGTVRGVIFASLDMTWFSENFVSKIKVLESGYAFLADENGVFIAHPNKALILTKKLADFEWGPAILQASSGEVNYTYEGIRKTIRFQKSEKLGWSLMTTVPLTEATAVITRMGIINLALGLGALVTGVVLIYFTARSITRPIMGVAESLEAGASQTSSAAHQVSSASQSLAEGSSEQAASLEET